MTTNEGSDRFDAVESKTRDTRQHVTSRTAFHSRLPNPQRMLTSLVADADSHRAHHGERSSHARSSDAHASRAFARASERRARARGRRPRPRVAGAVDRASRRESSRASRRARARLSHERGGEDDAVARQASRRLAEEL